MSELPRSLEAERALIGAALMAGELSDHAKLVASQHFTDNTLSDIWSIIRNLSEQGSPIDVVTTVEASDGHLKMSKPETLALLTELVGQCPTAMHADKYAAIILTTAARRKVAADVLPKMASLAYADGREDPGAVWIDALALIEQASEGAIVLSRETWTAAELAALEIPDDPWLLDNLLVDGGLNLLAGEFRAGKSFAALDLALTMASGGGMAWGKKCKGGRVLIFAADNSRNDLTRRVRRLSEGREIKIPHDELIIDLSPLDLGKSEGMAILETAIRKMQPRLICIDALVRYFGSGMDESSAGDVAPMMAGFRRLANQYGVTFLIVHHLRKMSGDRSRNSLIDRVRGSGDLVGAVDSALVMTVSGDGFDMRRNVVHVKCREAPEAEPSSFTIIQDEGDGLVLAFEKADLKAAQTSLVDTVTALMIETLQNNPGVAFTRKDLERELESLGASASTRTIKDACKNLKVIGGVKINRDGNRAYNYIWQDDEN